MYDRVQRAFASHGLEVERCGPSLAAVTRVINEDFGLVVTSLDVDEALGLEICRRVVENRPGIPVIVTASRANLQTAVLAIRAGAHDYLDKPLQMQALVQSVQNASQHWKTHAAVKRLASDFPDAKGPASLVGKSPAMLRVYDLIHRVGSTDASVLITGESGTGKELVARAVHEESERGGRPFVAVNCAAMPANLLESELFGHVKGAFTDAKAARKGLFEQAGGGTVLLDEIGEMQLQMQPALLRVLQERRVRPVGGNREVPFDARVIAATNSDLERDVEEGRFREDLYYRLNVVQIAVPPLRERGDDTLLLAHHFVTRVAERLDKPVRGITSEAARKLLAYDWPGNVRQLENAIERAVTLTRFDRIIVDDLPRRVRQHKPTPRERSSGSVENLASLQQLERDHIARVLSATSGNKTQAAKILGLDRRTLYRKLERYDAQERPSAHG